MVNHYRPRFLLVKEKIQNKKKSVSVLLTNEHAWGFTTLSAYMWSHAGSDNGWTCQSAALCPEPGKWRGPGDQGWVCYFVDSSQWISVDSWASQCPGTKPRLTIHGLPRVTWFVDSKANICLWIITLNESLSITAEKTWNSKQHAKCLQFWTHPALRPRAMSLLFWGFFVRYVWKECASKVKTH